MKKFTKVVFTMMALICSGGALEAQQWSDVGDPGFTSNVTATNPQYAQRMAMYNNIPYMVFPNGNGEVVVMNYTGGNWVALPATSSGTGCNSVHIAFDATGNLYVAYMNLNSVVFVRKYNGTNWSIVGSSGGIVANNLNSLVINPATNEPYVATYAGGGTSKATVYKFNGTSWVTVGAADFSGQTQSLRMAISSTGTPYLTIQDGLFGTTFSVVRFDGTNWVSVGAAAMGNLSTNLTDIAIDGAGAPYVYSTNTSNGKANVLKYNGTAWVAVGQADFSAGGTAHPFMKFDNSGTLHLAYQDAASTNGVNKATVMKFNGTSWVGVGNAGLSGAGVYYPTLAFSSTNVPFIGFRDAAVTASKGTVMKLCSSNSASVTSTTPGFVCTSGPVTLSATSSGTLRWYNAATNGLYVGTGTSYVTPSLTTTATYSVAAYDANGCSSPRTAVVASVNTIPTVASTTPGSRCGIGTVSLSAAASIGTINWFTASTGGSAVGNGSSFVTPSISTTATYYAEANNGGCVSASRTAVVATVNQIPTLGTGIGAFRCGPGLLSISTAAFPTGATVTWFAAPSGGSSLGTGNTFNTPSINLTTTYYAEANFNGCISASRQALIAEVRSVPSVTSSTGGETCNAGAISLNATTSSGSQARWYDVATGGTSLSSLNNFTTPTISETKIYYVEAMQNGCASTPRTAVVATIKPYPSLFVSDVSRCDAGTVSFEAASTGVVSWFAASTGGSALTTGPVFTTPSISANTSYFVESTLNGCTTPTRSQTQAIVITTPPQPVITQDNSNIEAPVLTSNANSGNQWYRNDAEIDGATLNTYTITEAGSYKVHVNNSGCISPFSSSISYVITGFEVADEKMMKLYPNPTVDELVVSLHGFEMDRLVNVMVVDLMGRTLNQSTALGGEEISFKVSQYNAGHYLVLASQGNRKIVRSFIKSR